MRRRAPTIGATATPRPVARRVDRAAGAKRDAPNARARARDGDSFFPRPSLLVSAAATAATDDSTKPRAHEV